MSKYTCALCKKKIEEQFVTRMTSKINIAVTLSALHVYTLTSIEDCSAVLNAKTRTICIRHCINAAQYVLADLFSSRGTLSMTAEGTSYLNEIDIRAEIPAFLNSRIKTFSNDVTVTVSDLNRYLNTYLKKYFKDGAWKIPQADNSEERRKQPRAKFVILTFCSVPDVPSANDVSVQKECDIRDQHDQHVE